ncbi:MAG TPA: PQQ-dependent dehydrogenase, methanol/ethanol family [Steroidobacteraceae bacterium]
MTRTLLTLCGVWLAAAVAAPAAAAAADDWKVAGGDPDGTYYSPLSGINASNIARLGFAWQYDLGTHRGQEATPIVIDGVMYTSGTWGYVYAVDAASGRQLWRYDPQAAHLAARQPCCDLVNRGVAVSNGRVYVAAVDGRLHALDARTGRKIWAVDTITDHSLPYSSTGAPLIAGKVVVIGNGGADMGHGGVRGYVSAFDLASGALKWRFYTVPPAPGQPYENPELAIADKTWDPHRGAQYKGGGTAWDGFAYDPKLDLVYFGTGNAAPYDARLLGPTSPDELFTAAILAVHAETGRLAWHYQTTPGDRWDFDSVQKLVMADLTLNGRLRHTIMQASKNGFFYVLDRQSGELLSAVNYTFVDWASRVDLTTGRPVITKRADWYRGPSSIYPSWFGGHTWNPMSYSRATHLMYIPVIDVPTIWVDLAHNGGSVKFLDGFFTVNGVIPDTTYDPADLRRLYGPLPSLQSLRSERPGKRVRELLRAWDPVRHKSVWEHETSSGVRGYDGGVMSTAGNLVFQGRGSGGLWVYAADSGQVLKVIQTGSHIMAAPMTYVVRGEQYIAVQAGYGGTGISVNAIPPASAAFKYENVNRIIAFKLDGPTVPTPAPRVQLPVPKPPARSASAASVRNGEAKFVQECSRCHVLGPSVTPDLRRLTPQLHAIFNDIVLRGALAPTGMERFDDLLSEQDVNDIHAYLIDASWQAYRAQQATGRAHRAN